MPVSKKRSPGGRRISMRTRAICAAVTALGLGAAYVAPAGAVPPRDNHAVSAGALGSSVVQYQEWLYPGPTGSPECTAPAEFGDGRVQGGVLKTEYWDINESGDPVENLASNSAYACNGYSTANAANVKAHSTEQFVTLSLDDLTSEENLTGSPAKSAAAISKIVKFTKGIGFTGIDIDFENYWSWVGDDEANYYKFLTNLATALHAQGLQLQVEGPPDDTTGFNYGTVLADGADQVVMMAYDDEYQSPVGDTCLAFSPFAWIKQLIVGALAQIPVGERDRFVAGLPSEAYTATGQCQNITGNQTLLVMRSAPGFSTNPVTIAARRDPGSGEIRWSSGGSFYDYNDATSLDTKLALVESLGVTHISVWVLGGGNAWFSAAGAQGASFSLEAEAPGNTLTGRAAAVSCAACSGGARVSYLGTGTTGVQSALTFNAVRAGSAGTYEVLFAYTNGSSKARNATITVGGGASTTVSFPPTGAFTTPGTVEVPLELAAGTNTVTVGNSSSAAPDLDEIIVPAAPAAG